MKPTIRISSRKSDLARLQAYLVGDAIKKRFKNYKIEYQLRESLGDRNLENPLWKMPEKGVFTQDFKQELLTGETDMVVHSWKDLPIDEPGLTQVIATLPREDERDLVLFKKSVISKPEACLNLKIYSSSPRREFNLKPFFEWSLPFRPTSIEFAPVRGNIQTRVKKTLDSTEVHGIIIAKAALDRLLSSRKKEFLPTQNFLKRALSQFFVQVIPLSQNPASAAQGALAIEIASKNNRVKKILKAINAIGDFDVITEERRRFKEWGGGCHQKMGVTYKVVSEHLMRFERGLDQNDQFIWNHMILRSPFKKILKPLSITQVADVHSVLEKDIFNLKRHRAKKSEALIVTKGHLLHKDSQQPAHLWASGVETWRQLAEQGFWVSGSFDSLGESGPPELQHLYGRSIKWKKLTHQNGYTQRWAKTLTCYQVKYKGWEKMSSLKSKTYFFWSHGELFLQCWKQFPWLRTKKHICGLGNTLDILSQYVENKNLITVYNYKDWKKKWIL